MGSGINAEHMKVLISAALQHHIGQKPTKEFISGLLKALGDNEVDTKEIDAFFEKLGDQDINDVIARGKEKMAVTAVAAAPAAASAGAGEAKAEEKRKK